MDIVLDAAAVNELKLMLLEIPYLNRIAPAAPPLYAAVMSLLRLATDNSVVSLSEL